jgi:hypothetical protein
LSLITRFRGWLPRWHLITRFRGRLRQWRRRQASKRQKATLREFVYLDEVSVYSLIASRLGPIATEFTETEKASLKVEVASSFGGGVDIGSQVLRKSIVQTTFKELYELEMGSFAIRPIYEHLKPPKICKLNDFVAATEALTTDGWIVDPDELARGQLLEVEVQLEAEDIFRVSAVVSALLEIIEEDSEIFGLDPYGKLTQVKSVNRILEKLLVGLVPVRGYATDYEVVEFGEKEWIVHRRLLNELSPTEFPSTRPLCVVGVAEQALFWKDVRRILFSRARFRVLCRMAQDGLQDSWTPVKLAHVLDLVVPGLGNQIDIAGSGALASMVRGSKTNQSVERKRQLMRCALISYATLLADHYGRSITVQDLSEAGLLSEQYCSSFGSQKERREAFDAIATFLLDRFGLEREPLIVAQYRGVALTDAGLDFSGQPMPLVASDDVPSAASSEERFLDTEFVAIYW